MEFNVGGEFEKQNGIKNRNGKLKTAEKKVLRNLMLARNNKENGIFTNTKTWLCGLFQSETETNCCENH